MLASIKEVSASHIEGCTLVPTMGALHKGHLFLVRQAIKQGKPVTVSIFVNPTQFGPNEDFSKYPRNLERDCELLKQEGVSWVFAPSLAEMYPRLSTTVSVPEVTHLYEGEIRPGHFDGVSTIVLKLFEICKPTRAIFGLKDLQQCAVIRRMVLDLHLPVILQFEETIRELDGLAMSSRNVYLSDEHRKIASKLFRQIKECSLLLTQGNSVRDLLDQSKTKLIAEGFVLDYFDLVDIDTFQPATVIGAFNAVVGAVRLGTTRLIDNILLFPPKNMS